MNLSTKNGPLHGSTQDVLYSKLIKLLIMFLSVFQELLLVSRFSGNKLHCCSSWHMHDAPLRSTLNLQFDQRLFILNIFLCHLAQNPTRVPYRHNTPGLTGHLFQKAIISHSVTYQVVDSGLRLGTLNRALPEKLAPTPSACLLPMGRSLLPVHLTEINSSARGSGL